jgi:hypothetical protein
VNLYEERGWPRLLRALEVGLERRGEMSGSDLWESSPPVSRVPSERPPTAVEGTMPQTAPERVSTGVHTEVMRQQADAVKLYGRPSARGSWQCPGSTG